MTGADDALLNAAKDLYARRGTAVGESQWHAFAQEHPDIAAAAEPTPDSGVGSDATRLAPGICWRESDKERLNRRPGPAIDDDLRDSSFIDPELKKLRPHALGVCEVCRKRLPTGWDDIGCEFASPMIGCKCSGCKPWPKKTKGRRRYCSDECEREMHNSLRRAHRAAEGKTLRASSGDPIAFLRASYKATFKKRAQDSKAESADHVW